MVAYLEHLFALIGQFHSLTIFSHNFFELSLKLTDLGIVLDLEDICDLLFLNDNLWHINILFELISLFKVPEAAAQFWLRLVG